MWIFLKHEIKYWVSSPMMWIFLLVNTAMVMGAVSSDNVMIGGSVGSVHKNAPFVIQSYYGVMSLVSLLMTTAFMNATAIRDFQTGMFQFVFSSPIRRRDYFFGKFIGALVISIIPLLGVSLGALIGPLMPWARPERYGEIIWSGHWQGLLAFGIPNTIIAGVILFSLAILYRNNVVAFVGAMLILVLYVISSGFTADIEKEWLANILDPFGFRPQGIVAKYMTIDEKNLHAVPLAGAFLFNRMLWLGIGFVILIFGYSRFSFISKREKVKKTKEEKQEALPEISTNKIFEAGANKGFSFRSLWYLIGFETRAIIKNPTFIIITVLGLLNLLGSITSFTGRYGTDQYPVTYDVIDSIRGSFYLFIIAIITFYTGVLIWKERDAKIDEIQDATPMQQSILFTSKLVAVLIAVELVIFLSILEGMIAQAFFGYFRFQFDVYFKQQFLFKNH